MHLSETPCVFVRYSDGAGGDAQNPPPRTQYYVGMLFYDPVRDALRGMTHAAYLHHEGAQTSIGFIASTSLPGPWLFISIPTDATKAAAFTRYPDAESCPGVPPLTEHMTPSYGKVWKDPDPDHHEPPGSGELVFTNPWWIIYTQTHAVPRYDAARPFLPFTSIDPSVIKLPF
jgi:hypothetical protein